VRRRRFDRLAEVLDDEFVMIAGQSSLRRQLKKARWVRRFFRVSEFAVRDHGVSGSSGLMATTLGGRATFGRP